MRLAGGLPQIVGEDLLILLLHFAQPVQHGGVVLELLKGLQLLRPISKPSPMVSLSSSVRPGLDWQQPPAVGDAVGHVGELAGIVQIVVVEDALLDDLAVQLGHAVDASGRHSTQRLAMRTWPSPMMAMRSILPVSPGSFSRSSREAAVRSRRRSDRCGAGSSGRSPRSTSPVPRHDRVVGVGEGAGDDVPGAPSCSRTRPAESASVRGWPGWGGCR